MASLVPTNPDTASCLHPLTPCRVAAKMHKVPQLLATYAGEFVTYPLQCSDTVSELAIWGLCSLVPRPPPRFYPTAAR